MGDSGYKCVLRCRRWGGICPLTGDYSLISERLLFFMKTKCNDISKIFLLSGLDLYSRHLVHTLLFYYCTLGKTYIHLCIFCKMDYSSEKIDGKSLHEYFVRVL